MPDLGTTDKLVFTITSAGAGITGETPTVVIQKQSNGYYFNGAGFTPTAVALAMTEEDATNFPGKYIYDFDQSLDVDITDSRETYSIRYVNTGTYALTVDDEISFSIPQLVSYTAQAQPGIAFTKPGFQSPDQTYVVTKNNTKRIKATFVDVNGVYYDPATLAVKIYNGSYSLLVDETYTAGGVNIKRDSSGQYYVDFADTDLVGDYIFEWNYRDISGGEIFYESQNLYVVDIRLLNLFPNLRNQIDKAQKDLGIFGYTDSNLYLYLKGGLSEVNRVPPATSLTFSTYPLVNYSQLLIDISTQVALQSAGLLSIDTDSNYSLQGNSFVVDHWSKISGYLSYMNARINEQLKTLKYQYLPGMGAKVERGPGFRQVSLWNSASPGISFGNVLGTR